MSREHQLGPSPASSSAVGAGPATMFWQESARLAMDTIGHRVDRERDGQPYFWTDLQSDPPQLQHQSWDYCDMSGRWVDALIRGRLMTGSTDHAETEDLLGHFLLSRAAPDGLFYNAEVAEFGSARVADMFCQSRVLVGLTTWYRDSGDARLEGYLARLARGLADAAVWDDGFAHFPGSQRQDGRWLDAADSLGELDPKVVPALSAPGFRTALLGGLLEYAELTDDRAARDLGVGLARHYVHRSGAINADGSYVGHTHSGGVLPTVLGVLRSGLAIGDDELVAWAQRVYDFTVTQATAFGWLPDGVGFDPDYLWSRFSETCALADFIEIGTLLSERGVGDYWDVVERCARNQLLENQILTVDGLFSGPVSPELVSSTVGAFSCAALPNSYFGWQEGIEGCCLGSGVRGLYLFWRHAVQQRGDTLVVNAPISRSTEVADVVSTDPYAGHLSIVMRQDGAVSLRRPGSSSTDPAVTVNGRRIPAFEGDDRCVVTALREGDEVIMDYPLDERTETVSITERSYDVAWKGRTVVSIEPPGEVCPSYQRNHLRSMTADVTDRGFEAERRESHLL